jgi:hypothetical protein
MEKQSPRNTLFEAFNVLPPVNLSMEPAGGRWFEESPSFKALCKAWDHFEGDITKVSKYLRIDCLLPRTADSINQKIKAMQKAGELVSYTKKEGAPPTRGAAVS